MKCRKLLVKCEKMFVMKENKDLLADVSYHVLRKSGLNIDSYLDMLEQDFAVDEISLYALSKLCECPVNVLLKNKLVWTPNHIPKDEHVDLHFGVTFVYLGDGFFAITRQMDRQELKEWCKERCSEKDIL